MMLTTMGHVIERNRQRGSDQPRQQCGSDADALQKRKGRPINQATARYFRRLRISFYIQLLHHSIPPPSKQFLQQPFESLPLLSYRIAHLLPSERNQRTSFLTLTITKSLFTLTILHSTTKQSCPITLLLWMPMAIPSSTTLRMVLQGLLH